MINWWVSSMTPHNEQNKVYVNGTGDSSQRAARSSLSNMMYAKTRSVPCFVISGMEGEEWMRKSEAIFRNLLGNRHDRRALVLPQDQHAMPSLQV